MGRKQVSSNRVMMMMMICRLRPFTSFLERMDGVRAIVGDIEQSDERKPYNCYRYIGISVSEVIEKRGSVDLSQPVNSFIDLLR